MRNGDDARGDRAVPHRRNQRPLETLGELAELDETMMPFEVWVCRSCRHVELRVPPEYRTPAEEVRGLRYARPGCGGDVYHGQAACPTCGRPLTD